ncbi:glycoside hydrolase family 16 protein [Trichoderma evansii]
MYTSTGITLSLGALLAGAANAQYSLSVTYDASNFFSSFDFFTDSDPTNGFVQYVDGDTANSLNLTSTASGSVFMGVDSTETNPANGRKSVRVTSQQSFNHGLFIADIAHMPGSICGAWPAFWMVGPNWPNSGEIDIIEGVNTQTSDSITLHTSAGFSVSNDGSNSGTQLLGSDCEGNNGCSQTTSDNQNYGDGFNAINGGVYATEWTSDHISVWFFPRTGIPSDISSENPNPSGWGTPLAQFNPTGDSIDDHFQNNQLVFDTTFCGDWAGADSVWNSNAECSALASTCQEYVANNPAAFAEAFWSVNSIKVYDQGSSNATSVAAVKAAAGPRRSMKFRA